ncbi:YesL family protein [Lachnobacterium bovis]|uniref:Uncharacterized membrane protein YesL n=1 Tax=Lachnobacterium bovis TaxID=140626 RepID=A0A1H9T9T3_9FIRM|nr:DUF624 domain-containing protein [Lachnobacterium bovis]SER93807.1 Uncharacterized membrane protein YesL [Lachnobacterium bovis]
MNKNFSYESKFSQILMKIVDFFYASILWVVFSIPIVTIGASTKALFHVTRNVLNGEGGYVSKVFWSGFIENIKSSLLMCIIQELLLIVLSFDSYVLANLAKSNSTFAVLYYINYFMILYVIVWMIYTAAYNNRFKENTKTMLKNSAILAVGYLPYSIMIIVVFLAAVLLFYYVKISIFFLPAINSFFVDSLMEKIYRKHMSEEDLKKIQRDEEKKYNR